MGRYANPGLMDVVITVHLPDELAAPLSAAATARGIGVEQLAAELVAEGLVGQDAIAALEAFLGSGSSAGRHLHPGWAPT